ncbi:hypothetical protein WH50_12585 [Pokkaliibacter plantistimulans]|uniref:histidine kinase n=1 Tax=Pokkaliibacter plantistimulans TaxID=1635171 RepID=A0ABX5LWB7_9GAMM|nr:sensor histidine kinase KdpD [Pokkaliibacter plantistimulans]PXF30952.1 hypothetical protein WH50_12585 [Pokkaliibacter plantistimulans]
MNQDDRADALLAQLKHEQPGKLTVFLGAAPGVGKTYAMLNAALQKQAEGIGVVTGIVETHGREDTARLARQLPLYPLRVEDYQGIHLQELDLDGLLQRRPPLVLIDELAHSNVGSGRHRKRFQDVEELLAAGIDVYTTVNIQHIASLNDTVAGITGVRVRETVPDRLLEQASEIILVDLPPRELIGRLKAGKVYLPEQARAAIEAFFSLPNLTALRELSLRTVAAHVDTEFKQNLQAQGLRSEQEVQPRLMVCIDADTDAERLIRFGKQRAELRQMPWLVVHVDRGRSLDEQGQQRLRQSFLLAEELGAQCLRLQGRDVAAELMACAERQHVSDILLGRHRPRRGWRKLVPYTSRRLLKHGQQFTLTFLAGAEQPHPSRPWRLRGRVSEYVQASVIMLLAFSTAIAIDHVLGITNILMVLLVGVLVASLRTSVGPALFSALLGFIGFNFFFTEPRYTLMMFHREDILTVSFFLILSSVIGSLTVRLREQIQAQRYAQATTDTLFSLSRQLMTAADEKSILQCGRRFISEWLNGPVVVVRGRSEEQLQLLGDADNPILEEREWATARWSWQRGLPAGAGTDTLNSSHWCWMPLVSERGVLALLGIQSPPWQPERKSQLATLIRQLVLALERARLNEDLESARIQGETEQLKSALLSSVSHDLRTPLASMIGAVSSLIHYEDRLSPDDRHSLLETTLQEAERLNRYIQNLLDMTRLGYGRMKLERDWVSLDDIIASALQRLHSVLSHCRVRLQLSRDVPLLYVHAALIEQAIINILENAARFSPDHGEILISAAMQHTELVLQISDQGPGISAEDRARVFDMFYSVQKGDRQGGGTGLGLAICQGMVGAHGGKVVALPGPDQRGTTMSIHLPLENQPPLPEDDD